MKKTIAIFLGIMLLSGCSAFKSSTPPEKSPAAPNQTAPRDSDTPEKEQAAEEAADQSENETAKDDTEQPANQESTPEESQTNSDETAKDDAEQPANQESAPEESQTNSNETAQQEDPKRNETEEKPAQSESKKGVYTEKLKDIEKSVAGMKDDGTTYGMLNRFNKEYEKWDGALNEIYGVLKKDLSDKKMSSLRAKERKWLQYREKTAKKRSEKYEGGTQEKVEYIAALADITKQRCFDLVEEYMQ